MVAETFNMTVMRPITPTAFVGTGLNYQNSLSDQPGERAVFRGKAADTVTYDFGAATSINQAAVLYTDAPGTGEYVTLYGSNDNSTFTQVAVINLDAFGNKADPGYRHYFAMFTAVSYRYYRVRFDTAVDISTGRVALGFALQVEFNPDYGSTSWGYEEAPDPDTLDSGVTILEELPAAPYLEFQITWASEAEMETWWNQAFGPLQWKRRPVLVVRRPDTNTYRHSGIFWGILRLQPYVAAQFDMFEVSGKIRSMV